MPNSSITLLATCEWAKRFVFRRPLAQGNFNEPAITSANTILQTILGAPFAWRWNRAVVAFVTNPGQQDYVLFNWTANYQVQIGYVLVDSNGNSQQVTTPGVTAGSEPTWNATLGGTTTDGTAVWTNKGPVVVGNPATSCQFGWIENASIREMNASSCLEEWKPLTPKIDIALDSSQSRPNFIAAEFDNGVNTVTFRLLPVPDQAYPVSITIQQKPPIITAMSSTWAPIPDEYSRLYNWGFLALIYMYADDPRFQYANQKFVANLLSTAQGLTETERNVVLNNWFQLTGQPVLMTTNIQQGQAGKGAL